MDDGHGDDRAESADADGHDHDGGHGSQGGDDHGPDDTDERTTAPMSEFTGREAGIGAAVALVGLLVAFGVPLVLA